eukprot:TRINITY_DN79483_c0_g1_i1.p1 TRINITY_DN79483_c0_g1~~TRINITY_DN79483_c0_g1_i1.p1  ORF type:complete len:209 (+),score=56.35 TRINITY_DN79483_c0_g1_i1:80-706(+)
MQLLRLTTLIAAVVAAEAKKEALISTDVVFHTADLFYDVYDAFYSKFLDHHVKTHSPKVTKAFEDAKKEVCPKIGCDKKEVVDALAKAQSGYDLVKMTVLTKFEQIQQPLADFTHFIVGAFETHFPKCEGRIPRTFGHLLLFTCYIGAVMAFGFKVAGFVIRTALSIFCCVFCCGCCRRGKKTVVETKSNSKAAEKGKAAAKSTNKKK